MLESIYIYARFIWHLLGILTMRLALSTSIGYEKINRTGIRIPQGFSLYLGLNPSPVNCFLYHLEVDADASQARKYIKLTSTIASTTQKVIVYDTCDHLHQSKAVSQNLT